MNMCWILFMWDKKKNVKIKPKVDKNDKHIFDQNVSLWASVYLIIYHTYILSMKASNLQKLRTAEM